MIQDFYRGNTRDFRLVFRLPNPLYTGEPPALTVASAASGDYDDVGHQLDINSDGMVTEDWTLAFVSDEEFTISGATLGIVGRGNKTKGAHPINPDTGTVYFTLLPGGFSRSQIFQANDTITFSTISRYEPEDVTDLQITLTFIEVGATVETASVVTVAGDHPEDAPLEGVIVVRLPSGTSKLLTADTYLYGFERRELDDIEPDLDIVRTLSVGKVKILSPAKVVA
jgi:hypothetical protein